MTRVTYVTKRDGTKEKCSFDKVTQRIERLAEGLEVDINKVAIHVINTIVNDISTSVLDEHAAVYCHSNIAEHPDYDTLAARLVISNNHKNTPKSFSHAIDMLYAAKNERGESYLVSKDLHAVVQQHANKLDSHLIKWVERDFTFGYMGFKVLEEQKYLKRINGLVVERPQYMLMRVALGINGENYRRAIETFDLMSQKYFIHASPTLYNAGTPSAQYSSCFLVAMQSDSIAGIYATLTECAKISKHAGGIGFHMHNIRSAGSPIYSTDGKSNGLEPMLKVFEATALYVDQGGGKRKGSFAAYLEPWHGDIEVVLQQRLPHLYSEAKSSKLFYGMWVPDLFMVRVRDGGMWSLFDPNKAPGLSDVWGEAFETLYTTYEQAGIYERQVAANEIMNMIIKSQIEAGMPYLLFKDACNRKSNQQNLGTIKSSNLCTEIIEYSSPDETAVCNLASLCLPTFLRNGTFDFKHFEYVVGHVVENLNMVIDINYYPTDNARRSNLRHRPIGLGVQGLADLYIALDYPFDSDAADDLNKCIFETLYYAALRRSIDIARDKQFPRNEYDITDVNNPWYGAYSSFAGSPTSRGIIQPDMWNVKVSNRHDWPSLREDLAKYGCRNSLLVAPMPTASTSSIMGFTECFEPIPDNIYRKRGLSGEYLVINRALVFDLIRVGLWNRAMFEKINNNTPKTSIQNIEEIPEAIRSKYKLAREMPMSKSVLRQALTRAPFIDQSQSLNLFFDESIINKKNIGRADDKKITLASQIYTCHMHMWTSGSKISSYYIRTKAAAVTQSFTSKVQDNKKVECTDDVCTSCSA